MKDNTEKIHNMIFGSVYPAYVAKVERKGRTVKELHRLICWLTGYTEKGFKKQIDKKVNFKTFFEEAPEINPNASKITGTICGIKVQDIKDPIVQKVRYLDKIVDELAQGKVMDKILRRGLV